MIPLSQPMVKWQQARWSCSRSEIGIHHSVPRVSPDGTLQKSLKAFNLLDFLGVRIQTWS